MGINELVRCRNLDVMHAMIDIYNEVSSLALLSPLRMTFFCEIKG